MNQRIRRATKAVLSILFMTTTLVAYQNCAPGFNTIEQPAQSSAAIDDDNASGIDHPAIECLLSHGSGFKTWINGAYSECIPNKCDTNYQLQNAECVFVPGACTITNGSGMTQENGSCKVTQCMASYHIQGNACESDVRSCTITNGVGQQTWTGTAFGACAVKSCNTGYKVDGNACVAIPAAGTLTRIMPIGDSITWAYGIESSGGYRGPLYKSLTAAGHKIEYVGDVTCKAPSESPKCQAYPGWTIQDIRTEVINRGLLEKHKPNVILMMIGTNTLWENQKNGDTLALSELSVLIDEIAAHAPNAELYVNSIIRNPDMPELVDKFNAGVPGLVSAKKAKGYKIHFMDMFPVVPDAEIPDRSHPNEAGSKRMADAWFKVLNPVLP